MRNEVRVIWLEDSITGANRRSHQGRVEAVEQHIQSKGYQPIIKVVTNISEAKDLLTTRGGEQNQKIISVSLYYILEMSIQQYLKKLLKNCKMRIILTFLLIFHSYLLR